MKNNSVFVISGPSGAGKSTLIKHILETFDNEVGITISCTTRCPRHNEISGIDYHFITYDKFKKHVKNKDFIEFTECYGNKYGTLKNAISDVLKVKKICILDVDFNGAVNILSNKIEIFNYLSILILPPSIKVLKERLKNRLSENEETLKLRLNESFNPKRIASYDYVIINKNLEEAKENIESIIMKY